MRTSRALAAAAAAVAALSWAARPAAARHKDVPYVDTRDQPAKPVGVDPEADLREIMRKVESGELPKIQFETASSKITLESYPTLDAIAELMLSNDKLHLKVLAYTDDVGGDDYNLDLSERRARSVKGYLCKKGVPPPSITYLGLGEADPIADNDTEEGRAQNRRVEFRITHRTWDSVY